MYVGVRLHQHVVLCMPTCWGACAREGSKFSSGEHMNSWEGLNWNWKQAQSIPGTGGDVLYNT